MSIEFTLHTEATAPEASRQVLIAAKQAFGFVPNLHAVLAESPAALQGYDAIFNLVGQTGFTPAEQQVAFLAVNFVNECRYCMAGHSVLAKMAGLAPDEIASLRAGTALHDPKLQALAWFTTSVARNRGVVGDGEVEAFLAAGYTKRHVLEVVLVVATKTLSNYVNHLAETPADGFMKDTLWTKPAALAA